MNREAALLLLDYNRWANRRLLSAAATLPTTALSETLPGLSFGSLFATLAHILAAEIVWRSRCQAGLSPAGLPGPEAYAGLEALTLAWEQEAAGWAAYLRELDEAAYSGVIEYTNTRGQYLQTPLWQVLLHLVNHGTQFRAEAAVALTAFGASPGDLDLILYLRLVEENKG